MTAIPAEPTRYPPTALGCVCDVTRRYLGRRYALQRAQEVADRYRINVAAVRCPGQPLIWHLTQDLRGRRPRNIRRPREA